MNIALIIAGGLGCRMNNRTPKQFISVLGTPVIIYTLKAFQNHPNIDAICVSCLAGWEKWLMDAAKKYGITKLRHIAPGGQTGQDSIFNGLTVMANYYSDDDIVLIHDAVRPMVSKKLISNCIRTVHKYGNGVTVIPCQEAVMCTDDGITSRKSISRMPLRRTQAPQGFKLGDILDAHRRAQARGIKGSVTSCTLMAELARPVYFCAGSEKNIKLTTPEDFDIFRALLKVTK